MPKTAYELEREANIARNRALLEQLELKEAVAALGIPAKTKSEPKQSRAKPIQPSKRVKKEAADVQPRRQSARLRRPPTPDPNEDPSKKRKREKEDEEARQREEEERFAAEERARAAKKPRHQDLTLTTLTESEELNANQLRELDEALQHVCKEPHPRRLGEEDAFDDSKAEKAEVADLRKRLNKLKIVSRAKVTQDRIYSAAYHPDVSKDLIFFGDKHGQLGIWDARAPADEDGDDDDSSAEAEDREGGKYWRLQSHWPATSKSSISCIKFNPLDAHALYTSSYDCTIRYLSFASGVSREVFSTDDTLISSFDLVPSGHEMWISDASGGLTHVDVREDRSRARWYQLSDQKIGSVSVNPSRPEFLVTASNSRSLRIWDVRRLAKLPAADKSLEFDSEQIGSHLSSPAGKTTLRGEWAHGKSVSAAYWDPRGRSIVSTCYDDTLRIWDYKPSVFEDNAKFPTSRPFCHIKHDCQTGRWLTILKATWSPNPDAYPHFTVGNMKHSLDIYSGKGELLARLHDSSKITAVQAVTASHPNIVERAASGNASGRCVLWAPPEDD